MQYVYIQEVVEGRKLRNQNVTFASIGYGVPFALSKRIGNRHIEVFRPSFIKGYTISDGIHKNDIIISLADGCATPCKPDTIVYPTEDKILVAD